MKSPNLKERQFDMLMYEVGISEHYFKCNDRIEEAQDLVRKVFGPNKKATEAKLNEIKEVKNWRKC